MSTAAIRYDKVRTNTPAYASLTGPTYSLEIQAGRLQIVTTEGQTKANSVRTLVGRNKRSALRRMRTDRTGIES